MDPELPLVSVCVITYNSGKTVLKTLDSILAQTYAPIELVVSDDCSTDDTVSICREWLLAHGKRFVDTKLIERKKNGGVAKNLNESILAATGEWVKTIAGDDLLLPNCIEDNVAYVCNHETQGIVFSKIQFFQENPDGEMVLMDYFAPNKTVVGYYALSADEQYQHLLRQCFTPSTSVFQKRTLAVEYPFPEQYAFCEDDPHWLHLTKKGIKLSYFDKLTTLYRVNTSSLSRAGSDSFINARFHHSYMAFFYTDVYPELSKIDPDAAVLQKKTFFLGEVALVLLKNRRNLFTRAILFLFKIVVGTRRIM